MNSYNGYAVKLMIIGVFSYHFCDAFSELYYVFSRWFFNPVLLIRAYSS